MSDPDLLEFLKIKKWGDEDKRILVREWNERRNYPLAPIGMNQVRTPCRLRQVRDSLIRFIETEKKVSL